MMPKDFRADVVVVGGGLAGLRAALAAAEQGASVTVLSQSAPASTEIMGINAPVAPGDSEESYAQDMMRSGCELASPVHSRVMAKESLKQIQKLETLGLRFDKDADQNYQTLHALGCTYPRVVHQGSETGRMAMKALRMSCMDRGVVFQKGAVNGLLQWQERICGVTVNDEYLLAGSVVLCAGGMSALHPFTTYPAGLQGTMIALAIKAGAEMVDVEFQQFEPCVIVYPSRLRGRILPTTLLKEGGVLRDPQGLDILQSQGIALPGLQKDVLSRLLSEQIQRKSTPHGGVWFDLSQVDEVVLKRDHSIFYRPVLMEGIDLCNTPIEVAPAAHTHLGGLRIDEWGRTGVPGLYAAGEICGGIHGANRLGGGSGAETVVFGARAGIAATEDNRMPGKQLTRITSCAPSPHELQQIRKVMEQCAGITRKEGNLRAGLEQLTACTSDQAMLAKAQLMASISRRESRGVFNRSDADLYSRTFRTSIRYHDWQLLQYEEVT